MTEPQAPAAKKAAPRAPVIDAALHAKVDLLLNSLADLHGKHDALTAEFAALKARADEAEKLLNSPAAKVVRGAQNVWKGLK